MGDATRRQLLKVLPSAALVRFATFLSTLPVRAAIPGLQSLVDAHPIQNSVRTQRAYRINATVLLVGIPMLRRSEVGTGCVSLETGSRGDRSLVALQFAAGSDPGRARGLNRFGVIREAAVLEGGLLTRSACAGFMTSSPENTLESAKQSLMGGTSETPCSMVVSHSADHRTMFWKTRFALPGIAQWHQSSEILSHAEQTHLAERPAGETRQGPLATFLYAVRVAVNQTYASAPTPFFYNGESHTLTTQREGDRLEGTIFGQNGAKKSTFTLWFDATDRSGLPSRIAFRARSFLHLTLEAIPSREIQSNTPPAKPVPSLAWLLREESA